MLFQAVLGRSLETTVLVVLGWRVRLSADWIYYKCYSQDVMRDLNFKPATQHKLHFIVKPETFQLHLQHLQNIHVLHCTLLHLSGFTLPLNLLCASAFYRGKQQLHVRCLASKAPAVGENTEMHISWWPAWPQRSNSGFGVCFGVYVGFCIQQKESGRMRLWYAGPGPACNRRHALKCWLLQSSTLLKVSVSPVSKRNGQIRQFTILSWGWNHHPQEDYPNALLQLSSCLQGFLLNLPARTF